MKSGKTAECSFNECVPSFLLVISGKDGFLKRLLVANYVRTSIGLWKYSVTLPAVLVEYHAILKVHV